MTEKCLHCCTALLTRAKTSFCCIGCSTAYNIINKLKLGKYYEYCKNIYGRQPEKIMKIENNLDYIEHIILKDNKYSTTLLIEGIHCGACIWLIENTMQKQLGIINARLNLSTKRMLLEWEGQKKDINAFVHTIEELGYKAIPFAAEVMLAQAQEHQRYLLKCLTVSGAASAQVMMLSFAVWLGNMYGSMGEYTILLLHLIAGLITIPAVFFAGMPFFKSAINAIRHRRSNMDVPISIGVIATTAISIQETILSHSYAYYDAAIGLLFVLLIGRYLELKARNQAMQKAHEMIMNQPTTVTILENNQYKLINIKNAYKGQVAVVMAGERIPVDGIVLSGESEVDNSIVTGETIPIMVLAKSQVLAGSINISGILQIEITNLGENTVLSEIIKLIENAKQIKSKYINLADKAAAYYTPIVFTAATLTLVAWYFLVQVPLAGAMLYAISVLIITCPCALGLAVPVVQTVAILKLMKNGMLLKSQDAIEKMARITDIVFDKTGTITAGTPTWLNSTALPPDLRAAVFTLASHSRHPLMQAVLKALPEMKMLNLTIQEIAGIGLKSEYKGMELLLGSRALCGINTLNSDDYLEVWLKYKDIQHRLIFQDTLRPEAKDVMQLLNKRYRLHLFSGDRQEVVAKIATEVGIDRYAGAMMPEAKYNAIQAIQKKGGNVLMIGDGINDSPALQLANVSMSPAHAIAIALNHSDVVYQRDLHSVSNILAFSKRYVHLIKQNFVLSFAYNILAMPIAMFGLITPLIAAIAMASSSITVVLNALRLRV